MRYIYYIIGIILLSSLFIAYQVIGGRPPEKKAALVINDRIITPEEFNTLFAARDPHLKERDDFINALITKELLIQEARKSGIDREESFRQSIQNFYEQSLVKILLDRKFASFNITVGDDEVKRYAELLNKRLHVTVFSYDNAEAAAKSPLSGGDKMILSFEELSGEMKSAVVSIKEGETYGPHRMGEKYVVVKLDKIEDSGRPQHDGLQPSVIKKVLVEEKREKLLNDWLDDLRKRASIKILAEGNR